MNESPDKLSPQYLQLVNADVSGLDIMHGELKNLHVRLLSEIASALEQEETI
jgi:hypothetical protein